MSWGQSAFTVVVVLIIAAFVIANTVWITWAVRGYIRTARAHHADGDGDYEQHFSGDRW